MVAPIVLGRDDAGNAVLLNYDQRERSTYMVGIQGSGKSTALLRIGLHDLEQGHGVCVITPDGDFIEDFLKRIPSNTTKRVILFDPTDTDCPFGLNVFTCDDPTDDLLVGKIAWDVVTKTFNLLWADSWGPQMEQVMRMVSLTITRCQAMPEDQRPTLIEFSSILRKPELRAKYVRFLQEHFGSRDEHILEQWDEYEQFNDRQRIERIQSTLNKTDKFAEHPTLRNIFGQATSKLNLRRIMDEGKVLLVDLSKGRIGEENSRLIGSVLVGQFYLAAISRGDVAKESRQPFHLIVDEFQNYANAAFFELQEQARKYAIDTVIAHQNLSQLSEVMQDRALGAGNKIVLHVTGKDAERLSGEFDATPPPPTVSTVKPKHLLSATPFTDLQRHSGMERHVAELVMDLDRGAESLLYDLGWAVQGEKNERARNRFVRFLNAYLLDVMIEANELREILSEDELTKIISPEGLPPYPRRRLFPFDLEKMLTPPGLKPYFPYAKEPLIPIAESFPARLFTRYAVFEAGDPDGVEFLFWDGSGDCLDYSPWGLWGRVGDKEGEYDVTRDDDTLVRIGWRERTPTLPSEFWGLYDHFAALINETTYGKRHSAILSYFHSEYLREHERREYKKVLDNYRTAEKSHATEKLILDTWYTRNHRVADTNIQFVESIILLARELAKHPIYQPSVYYEEIHEKPRTFADVRNEIANLLQQQEKYHAWLKGADGKEFRAIALADAPPVNPHWKRGKEQIKVRSREEYGRNRQEVEAQIRARRGAVFSSEDIPPER